MTLSLKHAFQSAKLDGADTSIVRPSDWNAEHALTLATDTLVGRASSGTGAAEEIACTAAGRAILDDANASAQRTTLGLAIGTDVQAYSANLAALAAATSSANKLPYFTGSGTADLLTFDTDGTLAGNSDTSLASQKAVKTYVDQIIASQDAMVFKGVIDCSANPNYPAADRGHTYRVSVAGKIGGASGTNVEAGDILICLTDGTSAGTQAAVGSSWSITQTNLDGAVIGPSSVTDSHFAQFDGTTGKLIKGGLSLDTDGTLSANSSTRVPSQSAVKTYAQPLDADLTSWAGVTRATGFDTFASNPTSANLRALLTDESGTGVAYFAGGNAGTPAAIVLTNGTGLPISTGVSGLGSNVATALATPTTGNLRTAFGTRELLTGATTFYVRTDGNDSNTGLANTSGAAFLTIQGAYDAISSRYDFAGKAVTVQIVDGTYSGSLAVASAWVGGGSLTFQGNNATPANVNWSTTGDTVSVTVVPPGRVVVKDVKLTSSNGSTVSVNTGGVVSVSNLSLGAASLAHFYAVGQGSKINITSSYAYSGGATYHYICQIGGNITGTSITATATGTLAFTYFAYVSIGSVLLAYSNTYTGGTITGTRYYGDYYSVIHTSGGGANYFPGNSAGSVTSASYL